MYRNQHYWNRKQELAKKALAHHQAVTDTPDYMSAYTNNEVFSNYIPKNNRRPEQTPECSLWDTDSVTAIFRLRKTYPDKRIAVLNFASYKEPGGRFLDGSSAQEESLCHQSTLYEALLKEINFYSWNNQHKNRSLYKNRAIYSRDIRFFDKDFLPANTTPADALAHSVLADVITCAAPNKYAAQKYCHVSDAENSQVLYNRIEFLMNLARFKETDILVLGAYGCGVFGQDPIEVASTFKNLLPLSGCQKVIFAIPDASGTNYQAFADAFTPA